MLWVPQKGIIQTQHNLGGVGDSSPGDGVTTGGTAATKGTAVQLIASTNFDAFWVTVMAFAYGTSAQASRGCLDIMVGAATEEVIIPNLLMGGAGARSDAAGCSMKRWDFPLYIPGGTRISAKAAGDRTSTAFGVAVQIYGGNACPPFRVGSKVTTYGIGTVPAGTAVTPGTTAAEGAWTEITASTTEDHFAFVPSMQPGSDTTLTSITFLYMDLGLGAATEEALLGAEQSYAFRYDSGEQCEGPWNTFPSFQDVPSGTRLVARLSNNGPNDTAVPQCAIHAVS